MARQYCRLHDGAGTRSLPEDWRDREGHPRSNQWIGGRRSGSVKNDKTQSEHNESGHPPIADIRAPLDFRPCGPQADIAPTGSVCLDA